MARGRKKKALKRRAINHRKRMIAPLKRRRSKARRTKARNNWHKGREYKAKYGKVREKMSPEYRAAYNQLKKSAEGRKALARYKKFWGLPYPMNIRKINLPGPKNKKVFLVGMGKSPQVQIADGPKGKAKQVKKYKKNRIAAVSADGKQIFILTGKNGSGKGKRKYLGYVPETHYIPTPAMEGAGTFKRGKYWCHLHSDEGGKWPKARMDEAGNVIYDKGTYSVSDWIRR